MRAEPNSWVVRRPFGWGVVFVGDATATDLPELPIDGLVGVSESTIVVAVRHGQDGPNGEIPIPVEVRCQLGAAPPGATSRGEIELPSGRLTVGDAEEELEIPVGTGRYRWAVLASPTDHPERVDVWLEPVAGSVSF